MRKEGKLWLQIGLIFIISQTGVYTSCLAQGTPDIVWMRTGIAERVTSVAFSPDGQYLASGGWEPGVHIWQWSKGQLVRKFDADPYGTRRQYGQVVFSPDGRYIAAGTIGWTDISIKIWEASDGTLVRTLTGHTAPILSVVFSPDGQYIASAGADRTIRIWQVSDGTLVRTLTGHTDVVRTLAFSPNGEYLASGSYDNTIRIWQVSDWTTVHEIRGHTQPILSVAFSPDGQYIASGGIDSTIRIWQVSNGTFVRTLIGHSSSVMSVAFSPNGQLLASAGLDGTVRVWRASNGETVRVLSRGMNWLIWVAFSPDGQYLAASGARLREDGHVHGGEIELWRVSDWEIASTIAGHFYGVQIIAISPNGQYLASVGGYNDLKVWRVSDGTLLYVLPVYCTALSFSPDSQYFAVGVVVYAYFDQYITEVRIYRTSDGQFVRSLGYHQGIVSSLAFSPDGQYLASGGDEHGGDWADKAVKLWRLSDGMEQTLAQYPRTVTAVAFSPDGQYLASGCFFSSDSGPWVDIWRVSDGALVYRFSANRMNPLRFFTFSPDSQYLAAVMEVLYIWRLSDGQLMTTLAASEDASVSFSPDGQYLAAVGGGRDRINIWRVSNWTTVRSLEAPRDMRYLIFSPDGSSLLAQPWRWHPTPSIWLWRVSDWTVQYYDEVGCYHISSGNLVITPIVFSPDGRFFVYGCGVFPATLILANNPFACVPSNGDVNRSGCVDDADLLEVLFAFGSTGSLLADVNCDGIVDDGDLLIVLFNFGTGC